ncbi:MAG: hypothetical protein KatS3mg068_0739 [Candidatus Sericytochromatia bacterium]|nr:MAG: hypothetical protein KatS3mg068_0739 [Candidatus Sericytochromatia bacterium]
MKVFLVLLIIVNYSKIKITGASNLLKAPEFNEKRKSSKFNDSF